MTSTIPKPDSADWHQIALEISTYTAKTQSFLHTEEVSGGDISRAFVMTTDTAKYFIKLHNAHNIALYRAEQRGLEAIAPLGPCALGCNTVGNFAYIAMEYLPIGSRGSDSALANTLVTLHSRTSDCYGWPENNFIGLTPQHNPSTTKWADFWWKARIRPQLRLAYKQGHQAALSPLENKLRDAIYRLLKHHQPTPRLLHGDLWSGNKGFVTSDRALIFDPACYYGDRETDIAMTELFGGFSDGFYRDYNASLPLQTEYAQRKPLYNLYHLLNHLNLFGAGYLDQCVNVIRRL